MPLEQEAYYGELDKSRFSMIEVAAVESYKGMVFATMAPDAPSLSDYLGGMKWYLDVWLDAMPAGTELIGAPSKVELPVNWKLGVEVTVMAKLDLDLKSSSGLVSSPV
ncbi:hypothetical protein [Pseudomonas putida]|uniref:hypothetical protein n=1 Tax=Pseudomonas putida TaxID=303 RepID=UPI0002D760A2|nr:hypothetical protein [Pseudomonas putida]